MRLLLAAAVFATLATPAAAGELVIFDDATRDSFVPAPGGGPADPGAQILWNSALTDAAGKDLGSSAGQCLRLDAAGAYLCTTVFYLAEGALVLVGRQEVEPTPSLWVITGGSGSYAGARGEATAVPVEQRARFRYTIKFAD
jgi:hypothetical protein